jgi:hypothetical protein
LTLADTRVELVDWQHLKLHVDADVIELVAGLRAPGARGC